VSDSTHYTLVRDRQGMIWDLLLYVPTVVVLGLLGLKFWYDTRPEFAYLLFFLASFFFIAGANRILKTRLMLLPGAPVALEIGKARLRLALRNGEQVDLIKDLRYYADSQGKSFGLSGSDVLGRRLQYILHRGQFADFAAYQDATAKLKIYS
jgi:hypothetical protein